MSAGASEIIEVVAVGGDGASKRVRIANIAELAAVLIEMIGPGGEGSGDVVGPDGAVDLRIAVFDGTTGKLIKDGGVTVSGLTVGAASDTAAGKVELATLEEVATGTDTARAVTPAGAAANYPKKVASSTDNALIRFDGTTGQHQATGIIIDDANGMTFPADSRLRGTIKALTDAETVAIDMAQGNVFSVTLGGNRSIGNPTSLAAGQAGILYVIQDATGGRVPSWGSYWCFAGDEAPALSTDANAVDVIAFIVRDTTHIDAVLAIKGSA